MAEDRQIGITWSRRLCAERLVELMGAHEPRLGKRDLSRATGLPYVQIQNFCQGDFVPSDGDAAKLASALGVPVETLRVIDLGPEGAVHTAANVAARMLAQAGWLFGLEPFSEGGRTALVPTSEYMAQAIGDWARAHDDLLGRADKTPTGRPVRSATRRYVGWLRSYAGPEPEAVPAMAHDGLTGRLAERWERDAETWLDARGHGGSGTGVRGIALAWCSRQLKALRKDKGLTQSALVERSGVKVSSVKAYETARTLPKVRPAEAIARALGVMPEALVVYDIATPLQLVHTLMDVSGRLGLVPSMGGGAHLETVASSAAERIVRAWAAAWQGLLEGDGAAYMDWYDTYDDARTARTAG